ncbi:hypothetical protein GQ53DRAFT_741040 [Thozetella sp. PMI_491]|nr:hypothetical protein GQ53DRAFT_741040 [Thozetella sp. PMI_491]
MQHHIDNVKWDHNMSQQSQQESFANCAAPQAYEQQGADYQGGPSRQGVSIGGAHEDPFTSSPPGPLYPDPELFAATGLTPGPVSNNFAPPSPVPASSDDCAPKSSPQPAKGVVPGMYAQNLYLDLAYTIEEMCPYQDIAARHNTTPAKVEKALKTIILLPMLRNITDKRRTGPLAQERKKDFQHATKAWKTEKAQDAVVRRNGGTLQRTQANESSESYEGKGKGRAATEPSAFELARFLPPLDIGDPFQDSDGDD